MRVIALAFPVAKGHHYGQHCATVCQCWRKASFSQRPVSNGIQKTSVLCVLQGAYLLACV
jgi:hypothetical protein